MIDITKQPFYLSESQTEWVYAMLEKLTVEQKVGQLFCVMGGDYDRETLKNMVQESKVGGILYRPAPIEEIQRNYRILDEVAPVPLLKAANLEEGGAGATSDGTLFGWPMMVSAANDDEIVEQFAKVCAVEGRSVGVNWSFSPVCDLDLNYLNPITNVRSYGSDAECVKHNTEIYVRELQACGTAACAKHFPGDGVDYRDHHLHPTYNTLSAQEWYSSYGAVYENLIANDLLSIMVGHIVQPNVAMDINPELTIADCLPASQSPEMLTGVLREKFGFNGVITTDATIMGGYCMSMERRIALPVSVMAGCDMIVFNTNFEEDYQYLIEAVCDGSLTRERLDEAVTRVLALKAKVCQTGETDEKHTYKLPEIHPKEWHRACADKSVTLVKSIQSGILPISADKYDTIRLITLGKDDISDGSMTEIAADYLQKMGFVVEKYEPFSNELHGSADLPAKRLTLYLSNYEQASNQTTVRIQWCPKHALDAPRFLNEEDCIFVSFANPYLLQDVPRIKTYINAYTATRTTIEAVIDKLIGKSDFQGKSPVDAFCGLIDTRL